MSHNQDGFSLMSIVIALVIMGIIASIAIPIGKSQIYSVKVKSTKDKVQIIADALDIFRKENNRFPCPANGSVIINDYDEYGTEQINCSGATCPAGLICKSNFIIGTVPFKVLGITKNIAIDDWDNKITYVIDKNHTLDQTKNNDNDLSITDKNNNIIVDKNSAGGSVFILISHGENDSGAWPEEGGMRNICISATKDGENCDDDNVFIDTNINKSEVTAEYYDDIVVWKVKNEIKENK